MWNVSLILNLDSSINSRLLAESQPGGQIMSGGATILGENGSFGRAAFNHSPSVVEINPKHDLISMLGQDREHFIVKRTVGIHENGKFNLNDRLLTLFTAVDTHNLETQPPKILPLRPLPPVPQIKQ